MRFFEHQERLSRLIFRWWNQCVTLNFWMNICRFEGKKGCHAYFLGGELNVSRSIFEWTFGDLRARKGVTLNFWMNIKMINIFLRHLFQEKLELSRSFKSLKTIKKLPKTLFSWQNFVLAYISAISHAFCVLHLQYPRRKQKKCKKFPHCWETLK